MANEICCEPVPYLTDVASSLYVILRDWLSQAFDWNDDFELETYGTANRATYAIPVTEQGTASGVYVATMPVIEQQAPDPPLPAVPPGLYTASLYRRLGVSPAEGDLLLYRQLILWDGTEVVVVTGQEFADRLLTRALQGGTDTGRTVQQALRASRNKVQFDVPAVGQFTVFREDDTTPDWTGTYTRPTGVGLTGVDPAN